MEMRAEEYIPPELFMKMVKDKKEDIKKLFNVTDLLAAVPLLTQIHLNRRMNNANIIKRLNLEGLPNAEEIVRRVKEEKLRDAMDALDIAKEIEEEYIALMEVESNILGYYTELWSCAEENSADKDRCEKIMSEMKGKHIDNVSNEEVRLAEKDAVEGLKTGDIVKVKRFRSKLSFSNWRKYLLSELDALPTDFQFEITVENKKMFERYNLDKVLRRDKIRAGLSLSTLDISETAKRLGVSAGFIKDLGGVHTNFVNSFEAMIKQNKPTDEIFKNMHEMLRVLKGNNYIDEKELNERMAILERLRTTFERRRIK